MEPMTFEEYRIHYMEFTNALTGIPLTAIHIEHQESNYIWEDDWLAFFEDR